MQVSVCVCVYCGQLSVGVWVILYLYLSILQCSVGPIDTRVYY